MVANTKRTMLDMFLDNTTGETYSDNRLVTRSADDADVSLIAYGWLKVAEYDESAREVTVFVGHQSLTSKTINEYLNDVVRRAEARGRDVVLSSESPTVAAPNAGVKYIGNYISMTAGKSAVDRQAEAEVRQSLAPVA